ncbi:hypothetical protein GCM10011504_50630 [Siccirubricoccus deserti]|nr:hypothetical protein GCM10011504_50630 [Siccirubricoccus deserti]
MAEPDQAGTPAQGKHLHEELGQRREMAAAELADGAEVRPVQRRHRLEVEALLAGARNTPRRVDATAVPYAKQGLIGEVYESARVLSEEYGETGRVLKVRGLPGAITRLQRSLAAL